MHHHHHRNPWYGAKRLGARNGPWHKLTAMVAARKRKAAADTSSE